MSATDHAPAGLLLLCRAAPDRLRLAARLLGTPLLLAPAGEGWSVLVPAAGAADAAEGVEEGGSPAARAARWATALTATGGRPVVGLWWDADGAGFVVAAGLRRTAGHTWLADGTPLGEADALRVLRVRLGLDPVLDAEALQALGRADSEADARARLRGLIAVLGRAGLRLGPGLAPGKGREELYAAASALPLAEAVRGPGPRALGPQLARRVRVRVRVLGAAEVGAGLVLLTWAGTRRRGWAAVGAALVVDGALVLAYERWRREG
ncbi:hypothetical protein [Streptomyces orinoci]|uniref:Uncharacterized protein n=1 Tax=Streptomyces orinoci TaxID=67339 RepID=A0ABV3JTN8_STRON|nr:hypothetical protein [Streptomyces orinoci]